MTTRNKTPLVVGIVLVVVAIVAIAAVVASRGGDDDDGTNGTTSSLPEELIGEIRPVTVEGSALPPLENPNNDAAVGLAAPVLVGESFDGSVVTTASEGGPVMVVFLAHWCPHCNDEIPRLLELEDAGRFPDDLKIVGVSTGVSANRPNFPPSEWIVEKGWLWPVMADGVDFTNGFFMGAEAFGVNAFPFITVVGADGNVLGRWAGESEPDDFIAKLEAALAA
ncbi:MAG TPA: TlpA disulfide reductase family protein [Ilumatobacteraceae bacterium]|nr:TlpA disulfide reductase family protein [Ilumatobacteraceae bacterium]